MLMSLDLLEIQDLTVKLFYNKHINRLNIVIQN